MGEKAPSVAVLNEKLLTAIRFGTWFIGLTILAAVFFLKWNIDLGEKLAKMQGTLDGIAQQQKAAIPGTLNGLLDHPTTGKIEAASAIVEHALKTKQRSDPKLLALRSAELLQAGPDLQNAAAFWRLATDLIRYRSTQVITPVSLAGPLPPCMKQKIVAIEGDTDKDGFFPYFTLPVEYVNCELILDSGIGTEILYQALDTSGTFKNCRIKYAGGNITFPASPVVGKRGLLTFIDCRFETSATTVPNGPARALITALLSSSDLSRAKVAI